VVTVTDAFAECWTALDVPVTVKVVVDAAAVDATPRVSVELPPAVTVAGENVPVTGIFGGITRAAVRDFQQQAGLRIDGAIGTTTWEALLRYEPIRWLWAGRKPKRNRAGATVSRAIPPSRPLSASLPAKGYEIPPGPRP